MLAMVGRVAGDADGGGGVGIQPGVEVSLVVVRRECGGACDVDGQRRCGEFQPKEKKKTIWGESRASSAGGKVLGEDRGGLS